MFINIGEWPLPTPPKKKSINKYKDLDVFAWYKSHTLSSRTFESQQDHRALAAQIVSTLHGGGGGLKLHFLRNNRLALHRTRNLQCKDRFNLFAASMDVYRGRFISRSRERSHWHKANPR